MALANFDKNLGFGVGMAMRMREYASRADYAHICKYADENIIHIITIEYLPKNCQILGQKGVSLTLFSILSAQK